MDNEKVYYVYIWYIIETNEVFYVGKGKNGRYKQIYNRNKFFKDMYASHNCDVRKVYENLTESEAFQKEQETIKWYRENTNFRLTNQTDGGEGSTGWVPPKEFREKQSKIQKKQWQDNEFKEKMMAIRTDENGPYKSQEFREKISQLVQGENNPNYNNHWTKEMKQHLSEVRKANGLSANENNPRATRVICIETGEIFSCIKFAMQKYNIKNEGSMTAALKHPVRTAGGQHWVLYSDEYLDDDYRLNYLINVCLLNPKVIPIICINDKTIYPNATALAKHLALTETYVRYHLNTEGVVVHNNKTYIKLSNYKDCEVAV
jgi:hypothetical protein